MNLDNIKHGIVFFTFDDRNFDGWLQAIPLFEKYNAHATFMVSGEIDQDTAQKIKTQAINIKAMRFLFFDAIALLLCGYLPH